jgi:hypothetical protein
MATKATTKTTSAKKTTTKKAASTEDFSGITAYCVKTKEKNVPMLDALIDVTNGKYIAKGVDENGNKMTAIMSQATAEGHVKDGNAKRGTGWDKK